LALPSRRRQRHSTYTHYTRDCGILGGRGSAGQAASQNKGEHRTFSANKFTLATIDFHMNWEAQGAFSPNKVAVLGKTESKVRGSKE